MDIDITPFVLSVAGLLVASALTQKNEDSRKVRKPPRWWVRPIFQSRKSKGDFHNLMNEMRLSDPEMFFSYTRMTRDQFDYLLSLVGNKLKKSSRRESLEPACRLAVTLRFLATGDSYGSLSFAFRISKTVVYRIIKETCEILWSTLQPLYLEPHTNNTWKCISDRFFEKWNLPNCCGSLDGKHVVIQCPPESGSLYYNYKHTYSIVLFAVCDADYVFTYVDIGAYGSQSDGGILKLSTFGRALMDNSLNLPNDAPLPYQETPFPFFFVGDEAFPLQKNLMRPYGGKNLDIPSKIFNYRLSRARLCIENAFGILVSRWRIFHRTINALPQNVDGIIKATVCLHNYIKRWEDKLLDHKRKYCNRAFVDQEDENGVQLGEWRQFCPQNSTLQPVCSTGKRLGARNAAGDVLRYRNVLKDYVNSPAGSLPWQNQRAMQTGKTVNL
ncbi:uncharacterized protein LOC135127718 [Zophobas morio]|uniref:uncharacterized protein LOC135127718 n=1 Tax=Zophobas morio TaxID=2755281 RepID=UPI0030831EF1